MIYYKSHGRIVLSKKITLFVYAYKMVQCDPVWSSVARFGLVWPGDRITAMALTALMAPWLPLKTLTAAISERHHDIVVYSALLEKVFSNLL